MPSFEPPFSVGGDAVTPSDAAVALSPVEAIGGVSSSATSGAPASSAKRTPARVFGSRSDQEHPTPALAHAEVLRVDGPVRPVPPVLLEPICDERHRRSAVEAEHVRYVLENHPARRRLLDEPKRLADEARLVSVDAGGAADLAEVGARESRGDDIDLRDRAEARGCLRRPRYRIAYEERRGAGSQDSQSSSVAMPARCKAELRIRRCPAKRPTERMRASSSSLDPECNHRGPQ